MYCIVPHTRCNSHLKPFNFPFSLVEENSRGFLHGCMTLCYGTDNLDCTTRQVPFGLDFGFWLVPSFLDVFTGISHQYKGFTPDTSLDTGHVICLTSSGTVLNKLLPVQYIFRRKINHEQPNNVKMFMAQK